MKKLFLLLFILFHFDSIASDSLTVKKNVLSVDLIAPPLFSINYYRTLSNKNFKSSARFGISLHDALILGYSAEFGKRQNRFQTEIILVNQYSFGKFYKEMGPGYKRLTTIGIPLFSYKRLNKRQNLFIKATFQPLTLYLRGNDSDTPLIQPIDSLLFLFGVGAGFEF